MPPSKNISFDELSKYFHLPINQVAKELGVCATILKKICRRNGIPRWPHRKIKSIDKMINNLEINLNKNPQEREDIKGEIELLRHKKLEIMKNPELLAKGHSGELSLKPSSVKNKVKNHKGPDPNVLNEAIRLTLDEVLEEDQQQQQQQKQSQRQQQNFYSSPYTLDMKTSHHQAEIFQSLAMLRDYPTVKAQANPLDASVIKLPLPAPLNKGRESTCIFGLGMSEYRTTNSPSSFHCLDEQTMMKKWEPALISSSSSECSSIPMPNLIVNQALPRISHNLPLWFLEEKQRVLGTP